MWAFTGGCHYNAKECARYEAACGSCPVLGSRRERDLSRWTWNRKRRAYAQVKDLTVVGLSRWLTGEARRSSLLRGRPVETLPNPIDTDVFRPVERRAARNLWNLPHDATIVLFGAMRSTSDARKGYDLLIRALGSIANPQLHLCVYGASSGEHERLAGMPVHFVGRLHDDVSLVALYSAADVMVVPSRSEAFGQTATEAMSCGTPVVAFGATGLLDIVDHQVNGYLARPYQSADLAEGIQWVLRQRQNGLHLAEAARAKVVSCFGYSVVAMQYERLYEHVSKRQSRQSGECNDLAER